MPTAAVRFFFTAKTWTRWAMKCTLREVSRRKNRNKRSRSTWQTARPWCSPVPVASSRISHLTLYRVSHTPLYSVHRVGWDLLTNCIIGWVAQFTALHNKNGCLWNRLFFFVSVLPELRFCSRLLYQAPTLIRNNIKNCTTNSPYNGSARLCLVKGCQSVAGPSPRTAEFGPMPARTGFMIWYIC